MVQTADREALWRSSSKGNVCVLLWRLLWAGAVLTAVSIIASGTVSPAQEASCLSCHTNKTSLRSMSPRWRDVYVDPSQFAQDKHGAVDCTACHGNDRYVRFPHSITAGNLRDPADPARVKDTCGKCHEVITTRHLDSLHSTLEGHKSSLVSLMGPEAGLARFAACTSCHTTCTDCHMKQPDRYGRLVPKTESHRFTRRPSSAICKVCHGQTAETYLGGQGATGHGPSVMAAAGLECVDCHSEEEVHGGGKRRRFIGETVKPTCEKCHARSNLKMTTAKGPVAVREYNPRTPAHQTHQGVVDCVACHTQWYTNCWDCHKGKAREDRDRFYLAVNPKSGMVHTAVHVPTSNEFGGVAPEMGGWAVKTRHSWGKSQSCEKCHADPDVYINPEWRRARFVSFWSTEEAKASFVDEKLVKQLTIDTERFGRSVHKALSCEACHNSPGNEVCAGCHTGTGKRAEPRAMFRETNDLLMRSKPSLPEVSKRLPEPTVWEGRWTELRDRYMQAANEFHIDPRAAQDRMWTVRQAVERFNKESENALYKVKAPGPNGKSGVSPGTDVK